MIPELRPKHEPSAAAAQSISKGSMHGFEILGFDYIG